MLQSLQRLVSTCGNFTQVTYGIKMKFHIHKKPHADRYLW